jgi:hypothetical protein
MSTKNSLIIAILGLSLFGISCSKTSTEVEITCGSTTPSFSAEVFPIIQQKCVSCHSDANPRGNVSLSNHNAIYANKSATRSIFASSGTHQGVSITTAQRNSVCCWIDSNAPNN